MQTFSGKYADYMRFLYMKIIIFILIHNQNKAIAQKTVFIESTATNVCQLIHKRTKI